MNLATVDPGRRPRVVLVEDHPQVREKLADLVHDAGFDLVATSGDVAPGYEAVCSTRPEIAVIDNRLPDGRGVALCEWLGRMVSDTALILHCAAITLPRPSARALQGCARSCARRFAATNSSTPCSAPPTPEPAWARTRPGPQRVEDVGGWLRQSTLRADPGRTFGLVGLV